MFTYRAFPLSLLPSLLPSSSTTLLSSSPSLFLQFTLGLPRAQHQKLLTPGELNANLLARLRHLLLRFDVYWSGTVRLVWWYIHEGGWVFMCGDINIIYVFAYGDLV